MAADTKTLTPALVDPLPRQPRIDGRGLPAAGPGTRVRRGRRRAAAGVRTPNGRLSELRADELDRLGFGCREPSLRARSW
jgi:hypothetical protein